jgi:hypothetical protein
METKFIIPYVSGTNGLRYDSQVDLKMYARVINDEASFREWIQPYMNSYELSVSKKDFDVFDFLDELKAEINHSKNTRKRLETFSADKKRFISWWNSIKKDYNQFEMEKYGTIIENAIKWIDETQINSTMFIVANEETIFEIINDLIIEHKEKLITLEKTAKHKYNKKRYAIKKEEFNIPDKLILTPEERVEHRKATQKKYYDKKRKDIPKRIPLTEEQKKENRRLANKKYAEKMKKKIEEAVSMNVGEDT